jgi:hypothetical protein
MLCFLPVHPGHIVLLFVLCPIGRSTVLCRALPPGQDEGIFGTSSLALASSCHVGLPLSRMSYPLKAGGQVSLAGMDSPCSLPSCPHPGGEPMLGRPQVPWLLLRSASLATAVPVNARCHLAELLLPCPFSDPFFFFFVSSTFSSPATYPSYSAFPPQFLESPFPCLIHILSSKAEPVLFIIILYSLYLDRPQASHLRNVKTMPSP